METPSAPTSLSNDSGEMQSSCSMAVAPMKSCATIWDGFTVKSNVTPCVPCLPFFSTSTLPSLVSLFLWNAKNPVMPRALWIDYAWQGSVRLRLEGTFFSFSGEEFSTYVKILSTFGFGQNGMNFKKALSYQGIPSNDKNWH